MDIVFAKSNWEAFHLSGDAFCSRAAADGFAAVEVFADVIKDEDAWAAALSEHGHILFGGVWTERGTPTEHLASLDRQLAKLVRLGAQLANAQIGSDLFDFADSVALAQSAIECAASHGIDLVFETHRSRPTFSAPTTAHLLEAVPEMRLCADLSHWMVVHESDTLEGVAPEMDLALSRTDHVHARIGFAEGPQVADWRSPERAELVERYVGWWRRVAAHRREAGAERLTVTPEFGPPPYAPVDGEGRVLADVWEQNAALARRLRAALE